ncbi:MAG TPA: PAS domain S-box protein [Anaerolineae bacterium]|nr:PAS domain S-box protein [Anaerolineae bacterium]
MSLLKKTLLVVASVVVVSTISLYVASQLTLLQGYEKIEQDDTRANVLRTVNAFYDQSKSLNLVARGYAFWDDMYRFVETPNQAFLDSLGLTPDLFATHKANLIAILDVNYNPIFVKAVDLKTLQSVPLPSDLSTYLQPGSPLLQHTIQQPEIGGVILLDGKPMYVASLAALHTDFTGQPHGAVIFGRYLDDQVVTDLAKATQLGVSTYLLNDPQMPADVAAAQAVLQTLPISATVYANSLDENKIAGYTYIRTLENQPAFMLRVELPRSIYAQGLTSFRYFAVLTALAGLCFIIATMLLLRRFVLSPLTQLNHEINAIRTSGDDAQRVQVRGHDEIASLGLTINEMLDELEKQSEERYRTLVENINDVIFALDAAGCFTYISPVIVHLSSYTSAEIIGQPFSKFVYPDDLPSLQRSLEQTLAGEAEPYEFRVLRKDGTLYYVRTHSRPLWKDKELIGLTGVMTDITQRKQAELALTESQQYLAAILNSVNDAIFVHDMAGKILDVNATACDMFGYTREELQQLEIAALSMGTSPYTQAEALNQLQRSRAEGPQLFEWRSKTKAGRLFWAEVNARCARVGDDERFFVTVRDISDRKQVEAEREKLIVDLESRNTELERFTYTVSHDLKAPLITIRGFLGLLEQDVQAGQTDRMKADMQRIVDAAQKMQRLLNELLELSRVGRLMNPPEDVSFESIAREALAAMESRLTASRIAVEVAPNLPIVYGDRARLVEVMQNLLDNASKFMGDQPHPHILVGSQETDRDGNTTLFVADNGIGIAPVYHQRIFGLFDKLDPRSEGTGIGLALVKRIIEVHGGRIWVESAGEGQGTTFYFTLPQAMSH